MIGIYAGASNESAIAIDENGVVDVWKLTDGTTERIASEHWSYIGHGIQWLEQNAKDALPKLTPRVHDLLVVDDRRVRA